MTFSHLPFLTSDETRFLGLASAFTIAVKTAASVSVSGQYKSARKSSLKSLELHLPCFSSDRLQLDHHFYFITAMIVVLSNAHSTSCSHVSNTRSERGPKGRVSLAFHIILITRFRKSILSQNSFKI